LRSGEERQESFKRFENLSKGTVESPFNVLITLKENRCLPLSRLNKGFSSYRIRVRVPYALPGERVRRQIDEIHSDDIEESLDQMQIAGRRRNNPRGGVVTLFRHAKTRLRALPRDRVIEAELVQRDGCGERRLPLLRLRN
jgi:hypothetical protein